MCNKLELPGRGDCETRSLRRRGIRVGPVSVGLGRLVFFEDLMGALCQRRSMRRGDLLLNGCPGRARAHLGGSACPNTPSRYPRFPDSCTSLPRIPPKGYLHRCTRRILCWWIAYLF